MVKTPKTPTSGTRSAGPAAPRPAAKPRTPAPKAAAKPAAKSAPKPTPKPPMAGSGAPTRTPAPVLRPVPSAVPSAAPGAASSDPVTEVKTLRKKELFERVVAESGVKKKDAKAVVEATLKVMGDALTAGEALVLPPFGKAKVNRQKDLGNGEMMVIKLRRQNEGGGGGNDTLADEDD